MCLHARAHGLPRLQLPADERLCDGLRLRYPARGVQLLRISSIGRPFPAACIRTSTERPEELDKACFTLAGISERDLLQAVHTAVELDAEGSLPEALVLDYADETVSTKVVKIIQSYTGVVDKMVWRKY